MSQSKEVETKNQSTDYTWEQFYLAIIKMNITYELPVRVVPLTEEEQLYKRLKDFMVILGKEIEEGEEIQEDLLADLKGTKAIVHLADWYADMVVYIFSEAVRHGIPLLEVLEIVMKSNMTKLGEDGLPIKDENGKFLKGPNFIPPEQEIFKLLARKSPVVFGSDTSYEVQGD